MDCTKIIGEKIKALRTAQEITLEELAEVQDCPKNRLKALNRISTYLHWLHS